MKIEIIDNKLIFRTKDEDGLFDRIRYIKEYSRKYSRQEVYFIKLNNNVYKAVGRIFGKLVIDLTKENLEDKYLEYYRSYYEYIFQNFKSYIKDNNKNRVNHEDTQLMRFLYAVMEFHCLQHIIIVDSNIMGVLGKIKYNKVYSTNKSISQLPEEDIKLTVSVIRKMETLGMFFEKLYIKDLPEELYNKLIERGLNKDIDLLDKIIFICPQNQEFFLDKLSTKDKEILNKLKLEELVLTHKIGHLIFNNYKINSRTLQERQANLISSYLTKGLLDLEITIKTNMQLEEYKNPLLITDKAKKHEYFITKLEELYEGDK